MNFGELLGSVGITLSIVIAIFLTVEHFDQAFVDIVNTGVSLEGLIFALILTGGGIMFDLYQNPEESKSDKHKKSVDVE